ncbi:uncharacterized protein LOC107981528 isoform X2 [Nasonia vitripennis]|uniref:Uncharacterized protein n=1 Tax=Nasonia vitripennis TaxID=7425 RepID=A0A7M7Q2U2_NASVI|nr:uncharacterized protein LOC107981528 isoform X2 [Nasonia vitripennis]
MNLKDFTTWDMTVNPKGKNGEDLKDVSPTKVKMIHLRFGVSIPSKSFTLIQKEKSPSKFLKKLARAIWTEYQLLNRAFLVQKCGTLDERSPRKTFTPVKKAVLRKLYFAFVKNHVVSKEDRKTARDEWRSILGDYISYLRKRYRTGKIRDPNKHLSSSSDSSSESEDSSSNEENEEDSI